MQYFVILLTFFHLALSFTTRDEFLWKKFKEDHNKVYGSLQEDTSRLKVFLENLGKIDQHNAKFLAGSETFELGITKFSDITAEEFANLTTFANSPVEGYKIADSHIRLNNDLPDAVDWRRNGVVGPVDDQGLCGACWASSALSTLESLYALKHGNLFRLSRQNLVDCTFGNQGCHGGDILNAYQYIRYQGIMSQDTYPYTGKQGSCKFDPEKSVMKISGWKSIDHDERALQEAVANVGPISAYVDSTEWQLYTGGILEAKKLVKTLNHVATIVGYGTENGTDYWLIKNSYGRDWGEYGYIRIARNKNMFGIADKATYPIVD